MKFLELSSGKVALVDDSDYQSIASHSWSAYISPKKRIWYASARINGKTVILSRFIMGNPPNMEVDHINGNGLDNRRINLRVVTHSQNCKNRSKNFNSRSRFKGVVFHKHRGKWWARIQSDGKKYSLGLHETEEAAALAYNDAARALHKDFAKLNFLPNQNNATPTLKTMTLFRGER